MTKIEWVSTSGGLPGQTWNPITGCTKISPGCKNCYAERMAKRLQAMGVNKYRGGFDLAVHNDIIEYPLTVRKPHVFFVCSMSDLFHEDIPYYILGDIM